MKRFLVLSLFGVLFFSIFAALYSSIKKHTDMKNVLLTAALMLRALGSNAQGLTPSPSPKGRVASAGRLTIEPRVGMTIATFTGSGAGGATDKVGLTGGFNLEYGLSPLWSFEAGVNYTQLGARDFSRHIMMGMLEQSMPTETKYFALIAADKNRVTYSLDYLLFPQNFQEEIG